MITIGAQIIVYFRRHPAINGRDLKFFFFNYINSRILKFFFSILPNYTNQFINHHLSTQKNVTNPHRNTGTKRRTSREPGELPPAIELSKMHQFTNCFCLLQTCIL